ncbi:hypothetical protein TELCIR_19498 [Teladorsagia circumcincta]|uniref:Uncharacterized protein n=1 Tax=Teladorsagia circumcincta TaxID=45464 RepID=A0A2G9TM64_TELCI|nr:hypothetical protein TELCIR_19498 [Teladorsagia circumcincta]
MIHRRKGPLMEDHHGRGIPEFRLQERTAPSHRFLMRPHPQHHHQLNGSKRGASVYRLLFKYYNPTTVPITATVEGALKMTHTQDIMQSEKVVFTPTSAPSVKGVTVAGKPFVMNPEKWTLGVNTKQRLFGSDYIVVLPAEYYLRTILKERAAPPYEANNVPIEHLSVIIGPAFYVQTEDDKKVIEATIEVPEDYDHAVVVEYRNHKKTHHTVGRRICCRPTACAGVPQLYPPAGNAIVAEAEAGQENPVSGDKLLFPIANPIVMLLD